MHSRITTLNNILHQWCPLTSREVKFLEKIHDCRTRSASKQCDDFPIEIALARGLASQALYHKKGSPHQYEPKYFLDAIVAFTDGKWYSYALRLLGQASVVQFEPEKIEGLASWIEDCKYRSEQDELNQ